MSRIPDEDFERRYRADPDPYDLAERWYERRKRAVTLACLPRERYGRAFEPGCGPGLLTVGLAGRCDALLAADVAPSAVRVAAQRVAAHAHVAVEVMAVPDEWPAGAFDLVVLSEIGYYHQPASLEELAERAVGSLAPAGEVMAVHYRPDMPDHVTSGDAVHERLAALWSGLDHLVSHADERFLLDVWGLTRPPGGPAAS